MPSPRKKSKKRSTKKKSELDFLLDIDYIKANTPNLEKMKTTLKKMKTKRVGLFANKNIKKGEVISYYLIKAYKSSKKILNSVYTISLYEKNGKDSKLSGDLCLESLQMPTKNGITYWAYFSNEPSMNEKENCELDFKNSFKDTKDKVKFEEGDFVLYKLKATKNIKKGDEILWCYGYPKGERDYKTVCEEEE